MNIGRKSEWNIPELIVLVRNKPEEAVLTACKLDSGTVGALQINNACRNLNGGPCEVACGSFIGS